MFEKLKGQWGYRASEELSYAENLQRRLQYLTLLTCYSLVILLAIVSFLLRFIAGEPVSDNIMLLVAIALLLYGLCMLLVFNRVTFSIHFISVLLMVVVPLRAQEMGGINAVVLFVYVINVLIAYVLYDRRLYAHLVLGVNTMIVTGFIIQAVMNDAPFNSQMNGYALIFMMFICAAIINLVLNQKEKIYQKLRQHEVHENENLILVRLTHEIFNALNIALHYTEELRNNRSPEVAQASRVILTELDKIRAVIQKMAELHENDELVERLKEHKAAVHFLDKV